MASRHLFTLVLAFAAAPGFGDTPKTQGGAMTKIAGGSLKMGCEDKQSNCYPVHDVTVKAFEMDTTPVTAGAYQACIDAGKCKKPRVPDSQGKLCNVGVAGKEKHPANCILYEQATAFCAWAGKRLPTEEEWEWAAQGSDGRRYPWGTTDPTDTQACFARGFIPGPPHGATEYKGTCEVGSFPSGKTPSGLVDMVGNVSEWTSTVYAEGYGSGAHAVETDIGGVYVKRGASWEDPHAEDLNVVARHMGSTNNTTGDLGDGFRCAR